ncbi:aminopeptidase [Alkalicoccobacillus porphyridii]|uniref:Aminopeptidase n=1 Tax=Alkalicoccobacillus porphyridii TaxID=2597270 RepID=A0A554A289_9BACI|nr:aminopeptidase [Alkalicoccobacillus porphyridii]TSB47809.1 aminopeptidase [Alkalicoccobacillus porphyridii]
MEDIYKFVSEKQLKKYADLAVRSGINVQKNQLVIIHSDIKNATLAHTIQKAAYEVGASNVVIDWFDEKSTKEFYTHALEDTFDYFPNWKYDQFKEWDDAGAAYIHIISENLEVSKGIQIERMNRFQKAYRTKLKEHHAKIRSHEVRCCLLAVPSFEWATKVSPHLSEEKAVQTLWELILCGSRANGDDPIKDWEDHNRFFESRKKFINNNQFDTLHFISNQGTDLSVGMPNDHLFLGGAVKDLEGKPFFPNIPTEEIFSAPHRDKVNGKLTPSKPLIYDGTIIDDFYLIFKEGQITNYYAATGHEALKNLIETDEGSKYLGEISLVSNHSPLSKTNTLFYNTLFDENTACHIGIGNASPSNLENGRKLSVKELNELGLNSSLILVNVVFGTEDMEVVGIKKDGTKVLLMKEGEFQF